MKRFYKVYALFLLVMMVAATPPAVGKSSNLATKYDRNIQGAGKIAQALLIGTGLPSKSIEAEGNKLFSSSADFRMAYKYHQVNNYSQAIQYYNKTIVKWPRSALAYFFRSQCFFRLNQDNAAFADVNAAIAIAPNYPYFYVHRGYIYGRNRLFSHARNDFAVAADLARQDNNPQAYKYANEALAVTPASSPSVVYPTTQSPVVTPNVPSIRYDPSSAITP